MDAQRCVAITSVTLEGSTCACIPMPDWRPDWSVTLITTYIFWASLSLSLELTFWLHGRPLCVSGICLSLYFSQPQGWSQRCVCTLSTHMDGCCDTLHTRSLSRPTCQLLLSYTESFLFQLKTRTLPQAGHPTPPWSKSLWAQVLWGSNREMCEQTLAGQSVKLAVRWEEAPAIFQNHLIKPVR